MHEDGRNDAWNECFAVKLRVRSVSLFVEQITRLVCVGWTSELLYLFLFFFFFFCDCWWSFIFGHPFRVSRCLRVRIMDSGT